MTNDLNVGDIAPDFELTGGDGETYRLSDYQGRPVVLVFYPFDFSGVCSDEHACVAERMTRFDELDAQVLGISVDSKFAHQAFAAAKGIEYPLLADFHPKGAVGGTYGVFDEAVGANRRWTFVIDKAGRVSFVQKNEIGVVPDFDEIADAVAAAG